MESFVYTFRKNKNNNNVKFDQKLSEKQRFFINIAFMITIQFMKL